MRGPLVARTSNGLGHINVTVGVHPQCACTEVSQLPLKKSGPCKNGHSPTYSRCKMTVASSEWRYRSTATRANRID